MRRELPPLAMLGIAWMTSLGACSGPDKLVGANPNGAGSGPVGAVGGGRGGMGAVPGSNGASTSSGTGGGLSPSGGPVGAPCLPADEYRTGFDAYQLTEVDIDEQNSACDSGICVVNHFQGRVSCPYGQTREELDAGGECFLPGSTVAVTVPVPPQRLARRPADTVICSCRCAGAGAGPFCLCPSDMECSPLVRDLGLPGQEDLTGSYCIPKGTSYDSTSVVPDNVCDVDSMSCGDPQPY